MKKQLSTRQAQNIRSGLDAGKGAARVYAEFPQHLDQEAILHFEHDAAADPWKRAMAKAFWRWLPVFAAEGREMRELAEAARAERRARDPKPPEFELRSAGLNRRDTAVLLRGKELRGVRSATISVEVGAPTKVELELLVLEVTRLCSEDPEIVLAPGVEDSLKALGWTAPGKEDEGLLYEVREEQVLFPRCGACLGSLPLRPMFDCKTPEAHGLPPSR